MTIKYLIQSLYGRELYRFSSEHDNQYQAWKQLTNKETMNKQDMKNLEAFGIKFEFAGVMNAKGEVTQTV